jgi:hypothetical protein
MPVQKTLHYNLLFTITTNYSVLKLFIGLAIAAFIAWKLTVNNAIKTAIKPARANIHQLMSIR